MPHTLLPASLRVSIDGDVTLTLDVVNDTASPAELCFSSAQQYEFIVERAQDDAPVWRWSDDRMFSAMLTSRVLAPGEHWVVQARWTPTASGPLRARGAITSTSHVAEASASFMLS